MVGGFYSGLTNSTRIISQFLESTKITAYRLISVGSTIINLKLRKIMKQIFGKCISAAITSLMTAFYFAFTFVALKEKEYLCAAIFFVFGLVGFLCCRIIHKEIEEYGV